MVIAHNPHNPQIHTFRCIHGLHLFVQTHRMSKNTPRLPALIVTGMILMLAPVLNLCSVGLHAEGSRVYSSAAHGFSLRVANAFTCYQGRYGAREYTTSDLLRKDPLYPELRDADSVFSRSEGGEFAVNDTANALCLRGPYGSYAVVFAAGSSFPSAEEMQSRVLDQVRTEAAENGASADDLLRVTLGEYTLCGLPATTLTLKRPTAKGNGKIADTLFTEIITARCGGKVYGIIMRGSEWMGRDSKTIMRQLFLSVAYGMHITLASSDYTTRRIEGTQVQCEFPTAWSKVFAKRIPFPVPVNDFKQLPASQRASADSIRQECSVLVVQTPTFQCEFFVTDIPVLDSAAWIQTCSRIFDRAQPAAAQDILDRRPAMLQHLEAYERSYSVFRRSDNIRTSWTACRLGTQLLLVRVVAWQREVSAALPVNDIIARCSLVP